MPSLNFSQWFPGKQKNAKIWHWLQIIKERVFPWWETCLFSLFRSFLHSLHHFCAIFFILTSSSYFFLVLSILPFPRPLPVLLSHPLLCIYFAFHSRLEWEFHSVLELGCLLHFPSLSDCQLQEALKAQERQFHLLTPGACHVKSPWRRNNLTWKSGFAVRYSAQIRFSQLMGTNPTAG